MGFEENKGWWAFEDDIECPHDSLQPLGKDDGNNRYFNCQSCGTVVMEVQSTREARPPNLEARTGNMLNNHPLGQALEIDKFGQEKSGNSHHATGFDNPAVYMHNRLRKMIQRVRQWFGRGKDE